MENISQENKKLESVIEPLTQEEEKEFDHFIEKIRVEPYSGPGKREHEWQIVGQFGERAVPYILKLPKNEKEGGLSSKKIDIYRFLDTLVTEKTAPLVLEAMQNGEIKINEGAIPASEGKEKTAAGLADLLFKLKWPNDSGRGNHINLIEAISLCGADALSPKLVEFYEKLRSDKSYSAEVKNHLKNVGNDLYECDAEDIVIALARLNGPISQKTLKELAENGDGYIKYMAKRALAGELYIGHPSKYLIEKPAKQEEYYSYKSDADLDDYDNSFSTPDYHQGPLRGPEQLMSKNEINFLDRETKLDEEKTLILKDYFEDKSGVFETLGKLIGQDGVKSLQDLPEIKQGEGLAAATIFELFKITLHLPDYKATREAFDGLKENVDRWEEELARSTDDSKSSIVNQAIKTNEFYIQKIENYLDIFIQEDFRLPDSALGFKLWHEGLKKERNIKPFAELFRQKISPLLFEGALGNIQGRSLTNWPPDQTLSKIKQAFSLYREVDASDVHIYEMAAEKLKKVAQDKRLIFYGRDADYFYYAVKAERFGTVDNKKIHKVYISSELKTFLTGNDNSETRERILAYLLQEKVTEDAIHIDTGYIGSVPEAVLRALNPQLKDEEINQRIKLLQSRTTARESITGIGSDDIIDTIESRPHSYGQITDITRDQKTRRLKVVYYKQDVWKELEAWTVNQAVVRHFAPRKK
ncbi:MAG: hypothetical protein Q7R75_02275 [bacterium]|nr:hypothetical protein [bacterium]